MWLWVWFSATPPKGTKVNLKAKYTTSEIPWGSVARSLKFCGCNDRGEKCHCMPCYLFFPLSFKLFIFFFYFCSCCRNQGWQRIPSRIRPSFRNPSILVISCKKGVAYSHDSLPPGRDNRKYPTVSYRLTTSLIPLLPCQEKKGRVGGNFF